jgi:hypothetical protein
MARATGASGRGRALYGLCAGAIAACLICVALGSLLVSQWDADQPQTAAEFALAVLPFVMIGAPFCMALLLLGSLIWAALRLRGWLAAVVMGFLLAFAPAYLWIWHFESVPIERMLGFAVGASILGVGGLVVALAAWLGAYRLSPGRSGRSAPGPG